MSLSSTLGLPQRPEPPALFRWITLFFVSIAMLGNYYFYDALEPLADVLKTQLHFSQQGIGLLGSAYSIGPFFTVLIGGIIIDRIGTRKSLLIFGCVCFVGSLITALNSSLLLMAAGRLVFGMGAESFIVAITTAVAKWFKGRELSFALGLNLMLARLGTLLAQRSPSWAPWAYKSWQTPWLIGVVFVTLCIIGPVVYWFMDSYASKNYSLGSEGEQDKIVFADVKEFSQSYWYLVGLCVVFYSAIFAFENFAYIYFADAHGASLEWGGKMIAVITICTMIGTPIVGLFSDKLGRRATMMIFGSALLVPVFLMMGYTGIPLYVPMAILGFAFTFVPAIIWPSVAYIVKPRTLGTALGLMTMLQNLGIAGMNCVLGKANTLAGASATHPAGYQPMLQILTLMGLVGLVFAFLLRQREMGANGHGLETIRAGD